MVKPIPAARPQTAPTRRLPVKPLPNTPQSAAIVIAPSSPRLSMPERLAMSAAIVAKRTGVVARRTVNQKSRFVKKSIFPPP